MTWRNQFSDNPTPLRKRFLSRVKKQKDGCWYFEAGSGKHPYKHLKVRRKQVYAHRISAVLYGLIDWFDDPNLLVCHTCDNPSCVNPKHLRVGTQRENLLDMCSKNRQAVGEKNGNHKLKITQVKRLRKQFSKGQSMRSLSREYKIDRQTVKAIVMKETWKHI